MFPLLYILLEVTAANWRLQRNSRGYLAMVDLDELYSAALGPADRRTAHRRMSAALFEQALGRALAWDIEAAATITEHITSPLAEDILGSLYPDQYPIRHSMPDAYKAARTMDISAHLDTCRGRVQRAA